MQRQTQFKEFLADLMQSAPSQKKMRVVVWRWKEQKEEGGDSYTKISTEKKNK